MECKTEVELAEVNVSICNAVSWERVGNEMAVGLNIPINEEYDKRQRLSSVARSTVPFAILSITRLFALLAYNLA